MILVLAAEEMISFLRLIDSSSGWLPTTSDLQLSLLTGTDGVRPSGDEGIFGELQKERRQGWIIGS